MRQRQSSLTAAGIAIVRAIESERPAGERICYDPYARHFVSGALYQFVRSFERIVSCWRASVTSTRLCKLPWPMVWNSW